jgi:hypothetical protein
VVAGIESLELFVELDSRAPPAGHVVLANDGATPARVWRTGNRWGDEALSFELSRGERNTRVVRSGVDYTRNVPASLVVPPGGEHRWRFDLGDGTWAADQPIDWADGAGGLLVAIYDAGQSPEAAIQGVSPVRLSSAPVSLDEPS